jgi:hypothetical protein
MHYAGLEPAITAIHRLQPTYTQTARPPAPPVWYSYWTVLTATLLRSSRVTEVWVRSRDFSGHFKKAYAGSRSVASSSTHPYPCYWVQVSCQLHAPAALSPWKDPLYPFHRSYLAYKSHLFCAALYCVSGSTILYVCLSHTIRYTARYAGKKLLNLKLVFWFSLQILSPTFHIQRRN